MRLLKTTLILCLCIVFPLSFSANAIIQNEFIYQKENITVEFDTNSILTTEQKQLIADSLVLGSSIIDDRISTYSLCWLTGHDIINEGVSVTEHKVSETNPRCKKDTYNVESCTKCDHMEYTLISSVMILCCPEE